ncbi:hypothetical protein [Halorussus caseinilyticus]|uniref:Uncharacterized protein n=1 Tax=Halorussus caseinilyticus TaxID=3034025 RepID=A0ABD5WN19_9EURY
MCNEEVKRQKSSCDDFFQKRACEKYLQLLRENRNPDVRFVEPYESGVENQGERSLETIFRNHPEDVKFVLLFDFDAIERFQRLKEDVGGAALDTRIDLPNYAFERLRRDEILTDEEYCKATYQMGVEEGWMKRHALKLDSVSRIDCPQFPCKTSRSHSCFIKEIRGE